MQKMWQEVGRMTDLIFYCIGLLGMWTFADGVASLWAYLKKDDETFWRNHSLRVVRMLVGVALMIFGGLLLC